MNEPLTDNESLNALAKKLAGLSTLYPSPAVTKKPADPLQVLRELQHSDQPPRIDMVTASQILNELLPASLKGIVSIRWIRANVRGKLRVGKQDMWPRAAVYDYFEGR